MIRKPLKQTANSAFKHLWFLQHNDKTMTERCQYSDVKSKKVWMDAQFEMPRTGRLNNSGRKKEQLHPGRWSCCNPSIFIGWSSIIISIWFSLGILLISLGLIGEYLGRLYLKVNEQPQYVIREKRNVEGEE